MEREVILDKDKITEILYNNHTAPGQGSHSGITATAKKITRHFWWKGVYSDVQKYVSTFLKLISNI